MPKAPLVTNSQAFYQKILENIEDLISVVDLRGRFLYISPSHLKVLGYKDEDLLGKNGFRFFHPDDVHNMKRKLLRCIALRKTVSSHARFRHKNGSYLVLDGIGSPILNKYGIPEMVLVASRDITEQKEMQDTIRHMALHDSLTGLPNRVLLDERANQAIRAAKRSKQKVGFIFLDLDNFKVVNDTYGHAAGDELLGLIAQRLVQCVRSEDTVARLGGDEFVLVINGCSTWEVLTTIATKLQKSLQQPFSLQGQRVVIGLSMGIALFPDHGKNSRHLFQYADQALYEAKEAGGDAFRFYQGAMEKAAQKKAIKKKNRRTTTG